MSVLIFNIKVLSFVYCFYSKEDLSLVGLVLSVFNPGVGELIHKPVLHTCIFGICVVFEVVYSADAYVG